MKKLIVVSLSLIVFVSCSSSSSNNETGGDFSLLKSTLARDTSPDAAEAEITELVTGNTNFAIDLYKKIKTGENIFFSPYSVSLALAMTYAGADGNTKTEMADTLHFTLDDARLHNAFNYLDLAIMNRDSDDEDDNAFTLRIANSIWGEKTYSFLSTFLDVLAENYGAGLRAVDFANDPNISRNTINDLVSDETEGKIEDLLPE